MTKLIDSNLFFTYTHDFLRSYLPNQLGRSLQTIRTYQFGLSLFHRYLNEKLNTSIRTFTFKDCSVELVQEYLRYLKESKNNSAATRNLRLTTLCSYLDYCSMRDISIEQIRIQIKKIKKAKLIQSEKELLSKEALEAILKQPKENKIGRRNRTMMIVLYDTAIRCKELVQLKRQDIVIDRRNPYMRIHGKGNKERIVPISLKTQDHLETYFEVYEVCEPQQLVFFTNIHGNIHQISEGTVERFVQQYADQARREFDIPERVYPHMFRRSRAKSLYRNGVELVLISRILGHSSIETTKAYAIPSLEMMARAIESVESSELKAEPLLINTVSEEEMARLCGLR